MKRLLILRHAKSDWSDSALEDFDRPLNPRGRKEVSRVARFLATHGRPDVILSSPARRAHETALGLVEVFGEGIDLVLDGRLYLAPPATLAEVLGAAAGAADTAAVVAHNPGLEEWIRQLTGARAILPPAGVACLDLQVGHWDRAGTAAGRLQWLVTPKLLKRR